MPVEWLLLSVSIFQAFQGAANFSWLGATLGFTQLTSIPLCVPHTLGSLGSPKEDSAKAMAFAGSWQDTGRSARALTSPKVCPGAPGRGGGCGGASAQRPGGEPDAPGPPCCRSLGDAPQDSRRLWERTSAVAGAAGARPPPRTARRPEERVRRENRRPATFPTSPPCGHRRGSRALREAPAGGSP